MRTLRILILLFFATQNIFADNSITIIGDLDDGYYFNQVVTLTLTFFPNGRLKHAFQEITYRDYDRTETLYEISVTEEGNTYTVSGYYNNRTGEMRNLLTVAYELNHENRSYSLSFPDNDRETDTVFISRGDESYGRFRNGEWPEVLMINENVIQIYDEKQNTLIVNLNLDQNGRVIEIHDSMGLVATATPLENSIEIHEIPIEGSATEYEIIIGEDYVPPQELHIRAFNVFITSLAGHAVYFPFLVGYF